MMYRSVYLLLLFITTIHAQEDKTTAGAVLDEGKIIGGSDAPFGKYPWFAKARNGNGSWGGCGGMLVAPEWVLTAAHCVTNGGYPAFEIGAVCQDGNCGQPSQVISTVKTISHPNYRSNTQDNDFALAKLSTAASANYVNMDLNGVVNTYNSNSPVWAIGFGNQNPNANGYYPSRLQHVEVFYVPQNTCNSAYSGSITSNMLCAADSGQDSCQGDSGGPLYDANNNVLVGVVSWGNGCAVPGYPGVYSKIFAQRTWIVNTICNDSSVRPTFCTGGTFSPTAAPPPCFNVPDWTDSYGDGCSWYENVATGCAQWGTDVGPSGLNANQACCVCGGGTTVNDTSSPTKAPTKAPTKTTSAPTKAPTKTTSAPTKAPSAQCFNVPDWTDSFGDGCSWYENVATGCAQWGTDVGPSGLNANQACCVCGGGTTVNDTSSPTKAPVTSPTSGGTCVDDQSFFFALDNGALKTCSWLTERADKIAFRTGKYCRRGHVKGACQESCDYCPCRDEPGFSFILFNGNVKDCSWLTRNEDKIQFRRDLYCYSDFFGSASSIGDACVSSCGFCLD